MLDFKSLRSRSAIEWTLRIGAFMCLIGHGAFGVITKEGWVRYFAVVGIGRDLAYTFMPLIGLLDITVGILILVAPVPVLAWWMLFWTIWTALLRPLAGEPVWETLDRGGNYGMPAALIVLFTYGRTWRGGFRRGFRELSPDVMLVLRRTLIATVVLFLVGHGALGLISKRGLIVNYASIMPQSAAVAITPYVGAFEIVLAIAVVVFPSTALFVGIAAWKVATEALFITAGQPSWTAGGPIWEFMERGGSYAAPLALAVLCHMQRKSGATKLEVDGKPLTPFSRELIVSTATRTAGLQSDRDALLAARATPRR